MANICKHRIDLLFILNTTISQYQWKEYTKQHDMLKTTFVLILSYWKCFQLKESWEAGCRLLHQTIMVYKLNNLKCIGSFIQRYLKGNNFIIQVILKPSLSEAQTFQIFLHELPTHQTSLIAWYFKIEQSFYIVFRKGGDLWLY